MRKIYIAGFDVSMHEVDSLIAKYNDLCTKYECELLFPARVMQLKKQNGNSSEASLEEMQAVFRTNLQNIDSADTVIVNMSYYYGFYSTDAIFEVGYAYSKGKQIIGFVDHQYQAIYYASHEYLIDRVAGEFGYPTNPMVARAISATIQGCLDDCLDYVYNPKREEDCKLYTISHRE